MLTSVGECVGRLTIHLDAAVLALHDEDEVALQVHHRDGQVAEESLCSGAHPSTQGGMQLRDSRIVSWWSSPNTRVSLNRVTLPESRKKFGEEVTWKHEQIFHLVRPELHIAPRHSHGILVC